MSVAEPVTASARGGTSSRSRTFGIDLVTSLRLPVPPASPRAETERLTTLEAGSAKDVDSAWSHSAATRVLERRWRDGRLVMSVDHDPRRGYRVYAPRNGRHLVSQNGTKIVSALPDTAAWRWQRLLFAQVLPLAATLQGLELLHASAVVVDGRAVGFVAAAGTGKTSVAAHVVASGGSLLTDDVLALEQDGDEIVAHSGASTLSIDEAELERMSPAGRSRLGSELGRSDKVVLATPGAAQVRRLERLYFLERRPSGRLVIDQRDPDPVLVLSSSFNTYVRTPQRIVNQLAIAARLTETVPMLSVKIPPSAAAVDVARAVLAHQELV